jgi:hypothetical protein
VLAEIILVVIRYFGPRLLPDALGNGKAMSSPKPSAPHGAGAAGPGTRCGAWGRARADFCGPSTASLKSARRAGSVAPGRLRNPWFPASRRFQARGFYEKLGYEEFGQLDYPPDHHRHFMQKRLTQRE